MESIILIGPKHSGKTSAGKAIASICSCEFFDLDELILQRTGKSPRQLFSEDPALFKKAEAEALAVLAAVSSADSEAKGQRVIASGGGIIDNGEALDILKKGRGESSHSEPEARSSGMTTVYLNISAETAWDRIVNSAGGELPPFLRTENPRESHRVLHERRAAAYLQLADIVIEAEGKTPEKIAKEILELSENFNF